MKQIESASIYNKEKFCGVNGLSKIPTVPYLKHWKDLVQGKEIFYLVSEF